MYVFEHRCARKGRKRRCGNVFLVKSPSAGWLYNVNIEYFFQKRIISVSQSAQEEKKTDPGIRILSWTWIHRSFGVHYPSLPDIEEKENEKEHLGLCERFEKHFKILGKFLWKVRFDQSRNKGVINQIPPKTGLR